MSKSKFFLFIIDHDEKIFTVWNVRKDSEINKLVCLEQKNGRDVKCFTSLATNSNISSKIKDYEDKNNYKYTMDAIIF